MNVSVALRLGRVSNLPTVWSNVLAGVALGGVSIWDLRVIPLLLALSLFYTGGMFLNDAFDWKADAEARRDRPIPHNQVTANTVFTFGALMLGAGLLTLFAIGYLTWSRLFAFLTLPGNHKVTLLTCPTVGIPNSA